MIHKIGFGGGCHWCTEAVFSSLKGVKSVQQGWIASDNENTSFSEGVIVEYDLNFISLETLVNIHLHTHSCTVAHSMREKYRSAVYVFQNADISIVEEIIKDAQKDFRDLIITRVLHYSDFKINREESLNYYYKDPKRPFCENYISPKLKLILKQFSEVADVEKLQSLK